MRSFWSRVAMTGNVCECWEWTGNINDSGYGRYNGIRAHRMSFELTFGDIPTGLQLDHLCRNRACVNPWHLEPVTADENKRRGDGCKAGAQFQRNKTHCPRGHEYNAANTYVSPAGSRMCIICRNKANLASYHRRKANAIV